jgi:hypothetical protein
VTPGRIAANTPGYDPGTQSIDRAEIDTAPR